MLLLPWLADFPYPAGEASYSDLAITHYPLAIYLRNSLLDLKQVPLWSDSILGGFPFLANPLSGFWYPPGWLALLFPLPFGFNLVTALHLLWGAIGMYQLLVAEGSRTEGAVFGALCFASMPKLFAHFGAGHLTLIYAVAWTPWLLWASIDRKKKRLWLESFFLTLIILADVRWAPFAWLSWLGYSLFNASVGGKEKRIRGVGKEFVRLFYKTILALGLSMPLLIPLMEYSYWSTRSLMTSTDNLAYSLPFSRLLGLMFPDFEGFHEWILYPGSAALGLAWLSPWTGAGMRTSKWWTGVFLFSLVYSLGENLPGSELLARMPVINLLRVPSRSLFLSGMAIAGLTAKVIDWNLDEKPVPLANLRWMRLAMAGLAGFAMTVVVGLNLLTGKLALNFVWGGIFLVSGLLWVTAKFEKKLNTRLWFAGLLLLCLVDWGWLDLSLFTPHQREAVLAEGKQVAEFLLVDGDYSPGKFRVYSPSYSLPQQTAANYDLHLADGIDPMQLKSYVDFMQKASGVDSEGYSVTLPPFSSGNPKQDNSESIPDDRLLGLLNVQYLVSDFDIPAKGFKLLIQIEDTRIYKNGASMPRAWVQEDRFGYPAEFTPMESILWTPDWIELTAQGPGWLVLSEVVYPGWKAWLDGEPVEIFTFSGLLRTIHLPQGRHHVKFAYYPGSLFIGLFVFFGTILGIVVWSYFSRKGDRGEG